MCRFLRSLKPSEAVMALYEAILVDMAREQQKLSKEELRKMKTDLASMDAKIIFENSVPRTATLSPLVSLIP